MFERGNPYKYVDPTGHIYWDTLTVATVSIISSTISIVGGLGLGTAGVVASPAAGVSLVATVAGVALATYGFANLGDGVQDAVAAIVEDDAYLANDQGGIIANTGELLAGEDGAEVGRYIEAGIGLTSFVKSIPKAGASFFEHFSSIVDVMDATFAVGDIVNNDKNNKKSSSNKRKSTRWKDGTPKKIKPVKRLTLKELKERYG